MPKCVPWAGQAARKKKKLFEYRRVAIVQCAAAPGLPSLAYLPHCVRGAHVNLSNWMQRQTLETLDRQTDTLPPVCGHLRHFFSFFLISFYSFAYNRYAARPREFWFIPQWQRHLYAVAALFLVRAHIKFAVFPFFSHEKCKCVAHEISCQTDFIIALETVQFFCSPA